MDVYAQKYEEIVKNYPTLLNKEEEIGLLSILKKYENGKQKEKAQETLVGSNYRLILRQASNYKSHTQLPVEDLVSAGLQGFITALNNFDFKYNTRLSTLAVPWINLYILRLITSFNSVVYIPSHILLKRQQYKKMLDNVFGMDTPLNDKELMEYLDVSEKMLRGIKSSHESSTISLDDDFHKEGEESRTISEIIPDTKFASASTICEDKDDKSSLRKAVATLDDISKDVITSRYLTNDKEDLSEVGKRLNITGERVRQIECKALKLLRRRLKNKSFFNINIKKGK